MACSCRLQPTALEEPMERRYVYAFLVDSDGRCSLLHPELALGNVENQLPLAPAPPYRETLPLGPQPLFEVTEPFGIDSYYLLSSVSPIPDPGVLECPGVREARGGETALEALPGPDRRNRPGSQDPLREQTLVAGAAPVPGAAQGRAMNL